MKILGVIGGLGPMATAFFMQMVTEMTDAAADQEHIEMLIYSCPKIPDRTGYILGESRENPAPKMIEIGRLLAEQKAEVIAVPCITAHYFYRELALAIPVPLINTIEEIRDYLIKRGVRSAGLMATTGTVRSGLFQKAFEDSGCALVLPEEKEQEDVMYLIYQNIKASKPVDLNRFFGVSRELRAKGAEVIILGCTELSVIRRDFDIGAGYLDAMQLLAKCAVERCGKLKESCRELITGETGPAKSGRQSSEPAGGTAKREEEE